MFIHKYVCVYENAIIIKEFFLASYLNSLYYNHNFTQKFIEKMELLVQF